MSLEAASSAASSDAASSTPSSASVSSSSSSSPQSTSDVAASVIADIESKGSSDTSSTSGDEAPPVAAATKPAIDPDDFDAVENDNPIPHKRVKAMVTKKEQAAEKRVIATIAKELGISKAEAELRLEDITGELTTRKTKFSEYESEVNMARQVESIMEKEPERFVQMVLQANPAYREVMAKVIGAAAGPQAASTPASADDPEPEMDLDLGDGRMTYSAEGFKKLREWERRQGKRDAEALINEKLSPFEQERKAKQEQARLEAIHTQAREAIAAKLDKARKWPEFTKHEEAIAKVINDTGASLEDAYMQVVMPKLAADRNAMREAILAEQAAQPRSTSVVPQGAPRETGKPKTTADYAREEFAKAGGI